MKHFFMVGALLALTGWLVSCSSPTDVPAGRKVTNDPVSTLSLPASVQLDDVSVGQTLTGTLVLENTSASDPLVITDISLASGSQGFTVVLPALPLTIGYGQNNNTALLEVRFHATAPGTFTDTVVVNGTHRCHVEVRAVTPAVIVEDVDFGTLEVGESKTVTTRIINNGNAPAVVLSAALSGSEAEDFWIIPMTLPLTIPAGSSVEYMVHFKPVESSANTSHSAQLVFDISYDGSGEVDNINMLTAFVE